MFIQRTRRVALWALLFGCLALSSCASTETISLKIHSDPEGAHIVYRVVENELVSDSRWIYLGMTPYRGVTLMDSGSFDDEDTISFKVMRHGYLDQVKEWTGEQFIDEYEAAEVLFWAPRLVKSGR